MLWEKREYLSKAFHGRTSLAVETTDNPKIIAPINANGHVTYLPLNDLDAFKAELGGRYGSCILNNGIRTWAMIFFQRNLPSSCR